MKPLAGFFIAFVTLSPGSLRADAFTTGNQLYTMCETAKMSACAGYIMGVVDLLILETEFKSKEQIIPVRKFCIERGVTAGQLVDIVIGHLSSHPETRHYGAAGEVIVAVSEAFPCPR